MTTLFLFGAFQELVKKKKKFNEREKIICLLYYFEQNIPGM